jgi:transcriptional regulator with XRE-family HTH domain
MSIGLRLKQLLDSKGLTAYMLADATGISQSTLSRILNKDSKPNASTLKVISDYFGIEPTWLLVGDNNESKKKVEKQPVLYVNENIMNVPLVNQYAYAGYMNGYNDPEFIEELPKIPFLVEKEHKGEYICFEVKGDSMDNGTHESYLERDILLCRNVRKDFWHSKLHINKWDFVIVDKDNGICVKRIIKHDVEKGIITCHSLNDYYEDFDIDLRNVSKIFNIVDIQRKRNRR